MKNTLKTMLTGTLLLLATDALAAPAGQDPKPSSTAKPTYTLASGRKAGAVDRVEVYMEVGGDVKQIVAEKVQPSKMSVVCSLKYDEKTLQVPGGADKLWRTIRHYDEPSVVIKVDNDSVKPTLRPGRRLIGVQVDLPEMTLFSPEGGLTRDELDLIDIQGNTALLDALLPEGPVAVGDKWKHSEKLLTALLGMDAVSKADVQSVLTDVTDAEATMELSGEVEAARYGASTEIQLKARFRFNRKTGRIGWLGLLVKENRDIGHVEPGVDAVARVQVKITPAGESEHLSEAALEGLSLKPTPELTHLIYQSTEGGWHFTHDRRWHVTTDDRELAVLRLVDRGELLAQCNVAPLPKLEPGKQVPLTEFQNDVQSALDKSFGEFVEAAQSSSEAGYLVYRVVVRGEVSELPIQWHYYLVIDQQGHRVVFAFTIEQELLERFAQAGEQLVQSLRFQDPAVADNALLSPTPRK